MTFFTTLAMALDTLPAEGRVLLLALLLTGMLYGFARVLPQDLGSGLNVLYRKGALLALTIVPAFVYLFNVQVRVPVDQVVRLETAVPGYMALTLLAVWAVGFLYHLYQLYMDLRLTYAAIGNHDAHSKIRSRAQHWQYRLNLKGEVRIVCTGAEQGWHVGGSLFGKRRPAVVILPAAALNWPIGVVDALLLTQLAQLQQGSWRWLSYGRVVQAIYWPIPWVARLVQQLTQHLQRPGLKLAAAAYRDPEGWQRDLRNLLKRASTLKAIDTPVAGEIIRLPNSGEEPAMGPSVGSAQPEQVGNSFEDKLANIKRKKRAKTTDPYEQVYWLIAVASIVVGIASTLTLVQAPPEFEPQRLNIKWQDQMVRRLRDFYDESEAEE